MFFFVGDLEDSEDLNVLEDAGTSFIMQIAKQARNERGQMLVLLARWDKE